MSAPSPWLRPLQFLAAALGVAIVTLFVAWVRLDAPPPVTAVVAGAAGEPRGAGTIAASAVPTATAAPAPAVVEAPPARPTTPPTDTHAVLYGSVKRADGSPMTSGVLWLYRGGEHVGTQSLRDGTFVFTGLTAGEHRLDSRLDDELRLTRTVAVEAPRTRLDIQLPERWLLTVNAVTPDGAPFVGTAGKPAISMDMSRCLAAAAFLEPLRGDLPPSNHGEFEAGLGRFRSNDPFGRRGGKQLPRQTLGVLTLPLDRPVHVALMLRNAVVAQMAVPAGQPDVTFTLSADALLGKTAKVRLRVVDEAGAPVVGARVALTDAQTGSSGTPTDAEGRIAFTRVIPGRLDLDISHASLCGPPVHVDVAAGADLDLGDVTLRTGVEVELDFENFGGKGGVRAYWLDAPPVAGRSVKETYISAGNGRTWKSRLFPGRHGLLATGATGVAFLEVDLTTPPSQPIRFDLQPASTLRLTYRAEASSLHLTVRSRKGTIVSERELRGAGEYTMKLPPGEYELEFGDDSTPRTRRAITLGREGAVLTIS